MPLSEHEQRLLEQIEQSLYAEDPKFARSWRSKDLHSLKRLRVIRAALAFCLGLAVLLAGVITLQGQPSIGLGLGVGGFLIMVAAGWYALATRGRGRAPRGPKPTRERQSVFARLEQRWQRRQDERGTGG